ncbi:Cys-tRNA(Pro) deacylase [Phytohalomonas tamaricis]|uniref:Cys-tRNA(Pro) deacylase n=1 Tax=Phytohalomonas tamaricis TaxID=2081032 RepID=UPI000D0B02DF|nr:Cys-tRNA(Pro) deacylase [Phytohalomonas tamaricis]
MTPAIRLLEKRHTPHRVLEYTHAATVTAYGDEAARALGQPPEHIFKTLLAALDDGRHVVAMVPVATTLDLKALARAAGVRKATMAKPEDAERLTGYVVGGISPLGQRKRLPSFLDISAMNLDELFISAGRRGLEIALAPKALVELLDTRIADIARH